MCFTIDSSRKHARSSSSDGCRERESNESVRVQGFVQARVFLCPGEALMKSERLRLDPNLRTNGLHSSIVPSAASQKLF